MAKDKKDDKKMTNVDDNVEVELKDKHETDEAEENDNDSDDDADEKDEKECKKGDKKCDEAVVKLREVAALDLSEDVQLLFNGQELSEEFKTRATTIFEAAVLARVNSEIEKIETEAQEAIVVRVNEAKEELVAQVDEYMDVAIKEWSEENRIALESGMRQEKAESFISDLAKLFEKHNIFVPDAETDALEEAVEAIDILKQEVVGLNEKMAEKDAELFEMKKEKVLAVVSEGLAMTQKDRLNSLVKEIDAKDLAVFEEKAKTIKQSLFVEEKKVAPTPVTEAANGAASSSKLYEKLKQMNKKDE